MCVIGTDVCRDVGDYLVGSRKGSDHLSGYSTHNIYSRIQRLGRQHHHGSHLCCSIIIQIV